MLSYIYSYNNSLRHGLLNISNKYCGNIMEQSNSLWFKQWKTTTGFSLSHICLSPFIHLACFRHNFNVLALARITRRTAAKLLGSHFVRPFSIAKRLTKTLQDRKSVFFSIAAFPLSLLLCGVCFFILNKNKGIVKILRLIQYAEFLL